MNACFYPLLLIEFWYLAVCPFSRRGLSDDSVKAAPAKPPTSKNNAETMQKNVVFTLCINSWELSSLVKTYLEF